MLYELSNANQEERIKIFLKYEKDYKALIVLANSSDLDKDEKINANLILTAINDIIK